MSTKKFTELSNYPSGSVNAATDILAIVDIASDESKKITVQDLGGAIGGGGIPTGSFMITGSVTDNTLTFTKGDGSTFALTVDTGSSSIPTLQQVTDQGSITTVAITGSYISASNSIYGSNYYVQNVQFANYHSPSQTVRLGWTGDNTLLYGTTITLDADVTASGAISASGYISASSFNATPGITNELTASYAITASYALNAASGGGTDISEVYFVTPSGDNGTAEVGNLSKPYSTPEGARAAAAAAGETSGSLIHVFPGEYTVTTILNQDYVGSFYFEPEAIINHTAGTNLFYVTSSVANSERELGVYGHGKFKQNGNGSIINMASSSRVYFECDTIIKEGGSANTIYLQQNADLDLKANLITGSWGSTYFITPRDESYVTAHINNLEYFGNTFCIYPRQGALTSPITTRVANEFTIENFIVRGGYGGLIGGGPSGRGNTFHLDVKNMYVTGSALGGFAVQSAGEVNYSKFVFHNAIMDCSSNSWGFFQDSTTTGESEIIFEGSLKYNGSNNNKPAFQFNGGDITLDMWVECSGSSLGYQINHQGGDLYLNKSLYNDTGGGIRTIGGNLYVDTYKAIVSGSSVLSSGATDVTIYNTFSSNVSASSDITFIGPGTYMSDQTGQIINNDVTITGSLSIQGSENTQVFNPDSTTALLINSTDGLTNDAIIIKENGVTRTTLGLANSGDEGFLSLQNITGPRIQFRTDAGSQNFIRPNLHLGSSAVATEQLEVTGNIKTTGDITVTGSLGVSETGSIAYLEPTETFINYITFCHNFGSAANTQFYCPWSDSTESPTTATKAAFQVPYSMSLHKLIFSTDNVSTGGQDIIFELVEEANSSGTITTLATSSVTSLAEPGDDATVFTLNASDFNNQVSFSYPNKARLLISSSVAFPTSNDVFVTSVWRQEIKL